MEVKNGAVYFYSDESALPQPRHSLRRLEMLGALTHTGAVAYQDAGVLSVHVPGHAVRSFEVADRSFYIYPVVTDTDKYISDDRQSIYEYALYKINFYKEYMLPVVGKELLAEFDRAVTRIAGSSLDRHRRVMMLVELYQLYKHAQDMILSKTLDKIKVEHQLRECIKDLL